MKLIEALDLKKPQMITLVGGGGKTSTLLTLAEEIKALHHSIVLTTTTAMYQPDPVNYDLSIIINDISVANQRLKNASQGKRVLLAKNMLEDGKLKGFTSEEMEEIYIHHRDSWFLIEGDGSKGKSLKVPAPWEPEVPFSSQMTILVIGADILGKEINSENIHRHHLLEHVIGQCEGRVDEKLIIDLCFHPLGSLKGIPESSKKVILFNKVESSGRIEMLRTLAKELLKNQTIDRILLGEIQGTDRILEVLGG